MDLEASPTLAEFRDEVRAFLARELPTDWRGLEGMDRKEIEKFLPAWREKLRDAGLLAITWPVDYGGRGLDAAERIVLLQELTRAGAPEGGMNDPFGIDMLGNTLLVHGTPEQRAELLPRVLSGEDLWCQGFSEPGAGSDLAAVSTTAKSVENGWSLNGQKVWSSSAHEANRVFVLCRTGEPGERHRGLSMLLCDIGQPGVEIRPIRMLSGEAEFNEIFFTDAFVPEGAVVGSIGEGWAVAMTLLGFERGENLPALALRHRADLARLRELASAAGAFADAEFRVRFAELYSRVAASVFLGDRVASRLSRGDEGGAEAAIAKLHLSETHTRLAELAVDGVLGAGLVVEGRRPHAAFHIADPGERGTSNAWLSEFLHTQGELIAAGTSEIHRNIIAERVLGLPK